VSEQNRSNEEILEIINIVSLATGVATVAIPSLVALVERLRSKEPATIDELRTIVADIEARSARIQAS
jgi:hypothetical protein